MNHFTIIPNVGTSHTREEAIEVIFKNYKTMKIQYPNKTFVYIKGVDNADEITTNNFHLLSVTIAQEPDWASHMYFCPGELGYAVIQDLASGDVATFNASLNGIVRILQYRIKNAKLLKI